MGRVLCLETCLPVPCGQGVLKEEVLKWANLEKGKLEALQGKREK
jgi:hypothetical protein